MHPVAWKQLARDCLSGGDYLLWKSFLEQCEDTANTRRAQNILISFNMLAGKVNYRDLDNQLNFNVAVYAQLGAAAKTCLLMEEVFLVFWTWIHMSL